VKLVHLVGLITKNFVTMHGQTNVKKRHSASSFRCFCFQNTQRIGNVIINLTVIFVSAQFRKYASMLKRTHCVAITLCRPLCVH